MVTVRLPGGPPAVATPAKADSPRGTNSPGRGTPRARADVQLRPTELVAKAPPARAEQQPSVAAEMLAAAAESLLAPVVELGALLRDWWLSLLHVVGLRHKGPARVQAKKRLKSSVAWYVQVAAMVLFNVWFVWLMVTTA